MMFILKSCTELPLGTSTLVCMGFLWEETLAHAVFWSSEVACRLYYYFLLRFRNQEGEFLRFLCAIALVLWKVLVFLSCKVICSAFKEHDLYLCDSLLIAGKLD